ncbi:MAG: phosphoribosylamine--glycine ligase [Chloroflexota bacterium]
MSSAAERILVIGGGGREHALSWRIKRDRPDCQLFVAPGNAGIAELATLVALQACDVKGIVAWCHAQQPGLVVVGPDDSLAGGIVDALEDAGIRVFGPTAAAARIESSKAWATEVAMAADVPVPESHVFDSADEAEAFVSGAQQAFVVKADGLALGKGVFVCGSVEETVAAIDRVARRRAFGVAGDRILLQERLIGAELSVFAICDGSTFRVIGAARDFKRIGDGDHGPNTGGMGAYTPVADLTPELLTDIETRIIGPTLAEMRRRGAPFTGFLYAGLMLTQAGPMVIEFNGRMGDPEAQVVLPLLRFDLVEAMKLAIDGGLAEFAPVEPDGAAVCVVLASGGYPGRYSTGIAIEGLEEVGPDLLVSHAGTHRDGEHWLTAGGRVMGITGLGGTVAEARERAYAAVEQVRFEGAVWRSDIAATAR